MKQTSMWELGEKWGRGDGLGADEGFHGKIGTGLRGALPGALWGDARWEGAAEHGRCCDLKIGDRCTRPTRVSALLIADCQVPFVGYGEGLELLGGLGPTFWARCLAAGRSAEGNRRHSASSRVICPNWKQYFGDSRWDRSGCSARCSAPLPLRHSDKMYAIAHQAIRQNPHPGPLQILDNQSQIQLPIGNREKHILAVSPPLGDMVGKPWDYHSRISWHHS